MYNFISVTNLVRSCRQKANRRLILISGIGMDSSVTPLRHNGLSLVQTTDCIYPIVDEPYMMGMMTNNIVIILLFPLLNIRFI